MKSNSGGAGEGEAARIRRLMLEAVAKARTNKVVCIHDVALSIICHKCIDANEALKATCWEAPGPKESS